MIFRNLDANGDWKFGQGYSNFVTGDQAIALNIKTRLLSWLNDCFFDKNAGIDWLNFLGSLGKKAQLNSKVTQVILQSYGVVYLNKPVDVQLQGREFVANYDIKTIFSPSYQSQLSTNISNIAG